METSTVETTPTVSYSRYNKQYRWQVEYSRGVCTSTNTDWHRVGIPSNVLNWCEENCEKPFGWHFTIEPDYSLNKIKKAMITFEDKDDAFWFSLRFQLNNI